MKVPAFDLSRAVGRVEPEVLDRWRELLGATAFVGGAEVEGFEREFADYLGVAGAVGVANGTDALVVALRALGVGPEDEVIVPSFTFIATAAAVRLAGGRPVLADVEEATLNLDLASAAERVTPRTVGIVGVHLYGHPFDLDGAADLCAERGLWLLEDAAQAHGARWRGERVGGRGRLATWSFYPSKNLGCFGDGGAVTGNDVELLERVRRLANHGRAGHYYHSEVGTNSRLDALQAAVLRCRLPRLDADNERRRRVAERYREALSGIDGLRLPTTRADAEPVYHQFTVRVADRDSLRERLAERGIGTGVHYPLALHQQPALAGDAAGELPVATAAAAEVLCLPMFPEMTEAEVEAVCAAVRGSTGEVGNELSARGR